MVTARKDDLKAFHEFVDEQLASGGTSLTPTETLDLWESQHASDDERAATIEALSEAIVDMRAGDIGIPVRDYLTELRRKYDLPTGS